MSTAMPTGIPAPPWDWEATVAERYGSAGYYTYWIDNTDPNATDTGNPNGSPAIPRLTIPSLASLTAGDVMQIRGGPYTGTTLTINGAVGTETSPIFIRGESPTVRAELRRQFRIRACSYLFIENLHWTTFNSVMDVRPGANGEEVQNVVIRNNKFVGTGASTGNGSAIGLDNTSFDTAIHHVVRAWNEILDCGDWQAVTENDLHALGIGTRIHDIWDLFNTCYHNGGDGVGNGHNANHLTYNLFIGGNHLYENRENAVDLKEVDRVVVSENICHGYVASSSSEGEAIAIHYGPDTGQGIDECWIINNIIYDSVIGIISTEVGSAGSWWIGNRIYDCNTALAPDRGGGNLHLFNNTIYGCMDGISCTGSITTLELRNNVVVDCSGDYLEVTNSTVRTNTTVTNELYWESGGGAVSIKFGSTYTSVAAWIAGSGKGIGSLESDPLFENAAAYDFDLQSSSPAIGAGYDWTAAAEAEFLSQFGFPISFEDYNGDPLAAPLSVGADQNLVNQLNITTLNATTLTVG